MISLPVIIFFLSSGLFLGWSLGANDAANVFGTAVASKMIKFSTAAVLCSIFLIIGAVVGGAGGAHTLGKLGAINSLAGAFTVALSAALSVFLMTKGGLPVSTSQAIVGGIIGWNFFVGLPTDIRIFTKIISTWFMCPIISLFFSFILFFVFKFIVDNIRVHLLRIDRYTRIALILAGIFGSYSLGANNIANVMGVFLQSSPFKHVTHHGEVIFTSTQILFLLGGLAIAVGVFTYSKKVMMTVGKGIFKLSPITALIVVISSSTVLFIFASNDLKTLLEYLHLPSFPLVPVSSSQAVVGAIMGIALAKGGKNMNYGSLFKITLGWIATPILSAIIAFVLLFFMQNVFMTEVYSQGIM